MFLQEKTSEQKKEIENLKSIIGKEKIWYQLYAKP